jgi:putative acetyltransferase
MLLFAGRPGVHGRVKMARMDGGRRDAQVKSFWCNVTIPSDIRILPFEERFGDAFAELNYAWINALFEVEPEDEWMLGNPREAVIEPGGEIFLALDGTEVVGTAAVLAHDDESAEIAKMAVAPSHQGCGISNLLMEACLAHANRMGVKKVLIVTNSELAPALGLYMKYGFRITGHGDGNPWARGNLDMELEL